MDPSSVDADRQRFRALYGLLRAAGRITQQEYECLMAIDGPRGRCHGTWSARRPSRTSDDACEVASRAEGARPAAPVGGSRRGRRGALLPAARQLHLHEARALRPPSPSARGAHAVTKIPGLPAVARALHPARRWASRLSAWIGWSRSG
jgi:hypothetical protein